jgi:SAM-dependent methyltransferase
VLSDSPYVSKPERFSSHTRLLTSLPASGHGRRVLDVGGGEGYLARALSARGYEITVVAAPGSAAADLQTVAAVVESDLDFTYPPLTGPFDVILCGDVLEHLRRPQDCLVWIRSLLAPGGVLLASLPNGAHLYVRLHVLAGAFPQHDRGLFDRTHLHFYSWSGWRAVFEGAGFSIEVCWPTAIPFGLMAGRWRHRWPITWLEALSYALAAGWKTLLAYQFVVRAVPSRDPPSSV